MLGGQAPHDKIPCRNELEREGGEGVGEQERWCIFR